MARTKESVVYARSSAIGALVSFPINLSTIQTQPVLVLSYERSGKNVYPRGWSDNIRFGPEHATYDA